MQIAKSTGTVIGDVEAKEIARRFLEQHFSIHGIKQPVLKDGIWTVTASISSFGDQARKVRIDAKSGRIIDWLQIESV